jgi:hypothetical protein
MDDTLKAALGILAAVAVAVVLLALVVQTIRRERRIRADLQAFARERGLRFDGQGRSGGDPARFTLSGDETGLVIDIIRSQSRKSGGTTRSVPGSTRISLPDPRFAGGLAVYSAHHDPATAAAASQLLGIFDNDLSRSLLSRVIGAEYGTHLGQLQAFDAPPGLAVTILATADPAQQFDTAAIAEALATIPHHRKAEPMILLGETGLKLRLAQDITDTETLAGILDTFTALQSRLR